MKNVLLLTLSVMTALLFAGRGLAQAPNAGSVRAGAPGVFSTSVLVGMQRRSVAAGFRTLLVIVCGLAGLFAGAVGLWLVGRIFHLHWKAQTALLTGGLGGLAGGLVLGLVLFFIFNSFFRYCRRRLAF